MMYFDNAATTYPKPPQVRLAVADALNRLGANPGRGGYPMALQTAEAVFACREELAAFFGLSEPANVCFTPNCTAALGTVIKGVLRDGGHAVISCLEHNSVIRPISALPNVTYTEAAVYAGDDERTVESFRRAIQPNTKLVLCTHASNVLGVRLPVEKLGALAQKRGILFAVDAAQSAGILPLDMERDGIDFLCLPGHKALYGPMGSGALLCRRETAIPPLTEGGTGSASLKAEQPTELPDRFESGTVNVPAICGLCAGVRFLKSHGIGAVAQKEIALMRRLYEAVAGERGITVYTPYPDLAVTVPMVTLNVGLLSSEETAALLAQDGVAVRAGLHCAPSAHRCIATLDRGAVRLCPSCFTTTEMVDKTAKILCKIARKNLQSRDSMLQ